MREAHSAIRKLLVPSPSSAARGERRERILRDGPADQMPERVGDRLARLPEEQPGQHQRAADLLVGQKGPGAKDPGAQPFLTEPKDGEGDERDAVDDEEEPQAERHLCRQEGDDTDGFEADVDRRAGDGVPVTVSPEPGAQLEIERSVGHSRREGVRHLHQRLHDRQCDPGPQVPVAEERRAQGGHAVADDLRGDGGEGEAQTLPLDPVLPQQTAQREQTGVEGQREARPGGHGSEPRAPGDGRAGRCAFEVPVHGLGQLHLEPGRYHREKHLRPLIPRRREVAGMHGVASGVHVQALARKGA